jgi:hypothetical protein
LLPPSVACTEQITEAATISDAKHRLLSTFISFVLVSRLITPLPLPLQASTASMRSYISELHS